MSYILKAYRKNTTHSPYISERKKKILRTPLYLTSIPHPQQSPSITHPYNSST